MAASRAERAAERLELVRGILRRCRNWHEAHAALANAGLTYDAAKNMYRRIGLRISDDLGAQFRPPYNPGPQSRPPVHIVDDIPPDTMPSAAEPDLDIPVDVEDPYSGEEHPTTPPPPPVARNVGWAVEEPTERLLLVPDTHTPHHDPVAWGVMMQAARRFRPTRIVILGDFLDFYQVSDHEKDPARCTSIAHDLEVANGLLDQLDSLGATRKDYVSGNHEFRLTRYLWTKAPALLSSVRLPELLKLQERGWSWTPYREHLRIHDLWVTHETGHAGQWAHHRSAADFMGSVVIGHTHRIGQVSFGNALGERFTATMCGWLGSPVAADYMHAAKKARDWSHGFGLGWVVGGRVIVQPVPIVDRSAVVDGAVVRMAG